MPSSKQNAERQSNLFTNLLDSLMSRPTINIRGKDCKEIENCVLPIFYPFMNFDERKLSLNYIKKEFQWYLKGDKFDEMITDHAQIWKDLKQPDGSFLSNYGQYWFNYPQNGFQWVVDELNRDQYSRRAVIPMLRHEHLYPTNKDVVCTECITFRIRDKKLNMTVHMRSNDAIWGAGNDIPCFWFLQEMVASALHVEVGNYVHIVDSMHIYDRHFQMANDIITRGSRLKEINYPPITDVNDLLTLQFKTPFGQWLMEEDNVKKNLN